MRKILTEDQIKEAKILHRDGYSKRKLAKYFNVSPTTIWENVFTEKKRIRIYVWQPKLRSGQKCVKCEIYLTREVKYPHYIPMNYQITDKCVGCYLEEKGLRYKDLL